MRALCAVVSLLLASCGTATTPAVRRSHAAPDPARNERFPMRLAATVHRSEEQGIDYVSNATLSFELALDPQGAGTAVRVERGVDVLGSDVHESAETVRYTARARWERATLVVALVPVEPLRVLRDRVEVRCERWVPGRRAAEPTDVTTRALSGVDWVCALPKGTHFLLGRVAIPHVPSSGEFLLLGEGRVASTDEVVSGRGRTVVTRRTE